MNFQEIKQPAPASMVVFLNMFDIVKWHDFRSEISLYDFNMAVDEFILGVKREIPHAKVVLTSKEDLPFLQKFLNGMGMLSKDGILNSYDACVEINPNGTPEQERRNIPQIEAFRKQFNVDDRTLAVYVGSDSEDKANQKELLPFIDGDESMMLEINLLNCNFREQKGEILNAIQSFWKAKTPASFVKKSLVPMDGNLFFAAKAQENARFGFGL